MKSVTNIAGIILIVVGVLCLSYTGFTYTTNEKVAEIGNIKITAQEEKTIPFSPILGGISLVAGLGLLFLSKNR